MKKVFAKPRSKASKEPIDDLKTAIKAISSWDESVRPHTADKRPGALMEFPDTEKREFIIVGDVHANIRNLKYILMDEKNLYKLRDNKAVLVFIGDLVHDDRPGQTAEMKSSIDIMEIVIKLFVRYPKNVIALLGNHDSFSEQLSKMGTLQGKIFKEAMLAEKGQEYCDLMEEFWSKWPLFIKHPYFLAVHAGPVRGGITREQIIHARQYSDFVWQMTWNRINETRSTPSRKEYSPQDLSDQRKLLGVDPKLPFIVGHNNFFKWDPNSSIWKNVAGSKDHVVVYSNQLKKCPYMSFNGSADYQIKYANLKIKKRKFVLDDY